MRCRRAAFVVLFVVAGCGASKADEVTLAKRRFAELRAQGVNMAPGPCLGTIKPDWVADVAHSPRRAVDDLPRNQCGAYRRGMARHFVELDPSGNLIRTG
jgi:hypothetical protein